MVARIVKFALLLIFLSVGSAVHAQTNTFCAADVACNAAGRWLLQSALKPNASNGVILVDQQDGSTADAKFAAACRQLPATGGTLDARGFAATTQTLANPISCGSASQPVTILYDPATTFVPLTSTPMVYVQAGNIHDGFTGKATSVRSYSANMVSFTGSCTDGMHCTFRNFLLQNGTTTSNPATGTALLLQAANGTNALYFVNVEHGRTIGFQNGILLTATGSIGSFYAANANNIFDVEITNAVNCITLNSNPGDVIGNKISHVDCEHGPQSATAVSLSGSSGSRNYGNQFHLVNLWDYPKGTTTYAFDPNTSRTYADGIGWQATAGAGYRDNGSNNNVFDWAVNTFANTFPIWKTSGDAEIQASANGHGLFLKGPDTQYSIQTHCQATGDLCLTLRGVGTVLRLTPNGSSGGNIPIPVNFTTSSATSDNVTVTGMTARGHCSLTPTNSSAATNIATTYVSAKNTNQITVTHVGTSGMTFDILCTPN